MCITANVGKYIYIPFIDPMRVEGLRLRVTGWFLLEFFLKVRSLNGK